MNRFATIICCFLCSLSLFSQSLEELKAQRKQTEKKIAYTNKLLESTQKNKQASLNKITIIGKQIDNRKQLISGIGKEIALLDADINEKKLNIDNLQAELGKTKKEYERAVYHTWRTGNSLNRLMYVYSGKDLSEVYHRIRYLHEFSRFRKQQGELLQTMQKDIQTELLNLENTKEEKIGLLDAKTQEQYRLQNEQSKQDQYVKELNQKELSLRKQIAQQQKQMNDLSKLIAKVVEEQIRKSNEGKEVKSSGKFSLTPEEQLVSDQFDANRGKLPWPVAQGIIVSKYGIHKHEIEKTVTVDNPGIDIQTEKDGRVRSIFKGIVTYVNPLPGYNMGVIIRHGEYLSFYANLAEVFVKEGDEVDTKQEIGLIYTDEFNGKTVLHFETWKGSTKNNPEYWIAR